MDHELYQSLCDSLDVPSSGTIQMNDMSDDVFQIKWPGNIAFTVRGTKKFGWFYVERNQQQVSAGFHYCRILDLRAIGIMQNLIDEAESGKYNNKKTLSDRIQDVIQQRQLTSYMNKTKWREMINDIKEIPHLSIKYKTLFDEFEPELYWTVIGDEYLCHMNTAVIEWFKIEDVIKKYSRKGLLLEPEVSKEKVKDKIQSIFEKHSIYYEYERNSGVFTVFGYR